MSCRRALALTGALLGMGAAEAGSATPSFIGIGDLPGGAFSSGVSGLSGNGRVAVGDGTTSAGSRSLRWQNGTLTQLSGTGANDASFNGSAIVVDNGIWQSGTTTPVTGPGGVAATTVQRISGTGNAVVGTYGVGRGYRWQGGTAVDLGMPAGKNVIDGLRISGDGSRIAFTATNGGANPLAYIWEAGVLTPLGVAAGSSASQVTGISANGMVVVGTSAGGFRWEGGVFQSFGMTPVDVSGDGSVILGWVQGQKPAVWVGGQISLLADALLSSGVSFNGWTLAYANAISDDGLTVAGIGTNPSGQREGWVAHVDAWAVPEPGTGVLLAAGLIALAVRGRSLADTRRRAL